MTRPQIRHYPLNHLCHLYPIGFQNLLKKRAQEQELVSSATKRRTNTEHAGDVSNQVMGPPHSTTNPIQSNSTGTSRVTFLGTPGTPPPNTIPGHFLKTKVGTQTQ